MTICVRRDAHHATGVVLRSNDDRYAPGQRVSLHLRTTGGHTTLSVDGRAAHVDASVPPLPPGVTRRLLHLSVDADRTGSP